MCAAVNFHVQDVSVMRALVERDEFGAFFKRPCNIYFFSVASVESKEAILSMFPSSVVNIVPLGYSSLYMGGFLMNIKSILRHPQRHLMNCIYFLHTQDEDLLRPILMNNVGVFLREEVPLIMGAYQHRYPCYKPIDKKYVDGIIERSSSLRTLFKFEPSCMFDEYYFDIFDSTFDREQLFFKWDFYTYYEPDLSGMCKSEAVRHWNEYGSRACESHRVSNPCYIKKFASCDAYYIAKSVFVCNRKYFRIFEQMDINLELALLQCKSQHRAWDRFLGASCCLMGGQVLGIDDLGRAYAYSGRDEFNLQIYKICSPDLAGFDNIGLQQHFDTYGKHENRMFSLRHLQNMQCSVNVSFGAARIAYFLLIPGEATSGGYRTLLRQINYLKMSGYDVDIYFGNETLHMNKVKGFSIIPVHLTEMIEAVDKYGEIDIHQHNFYLGLEVHREYDVLVANAWQIAEAVYKNREKCLKLAYIIQDEEYLFYPDDVALQEKVSETYRTEFSYFCVTKYLTIKFVQRGLNVTSSFLGVNKDVYYVNQQKVRDDGVVVAYYESKPGRLPDLMRQVIARVSKTRTCYIFPDVCQEEESSQNVVHCGKMTPQELSDLYNLHEVGIVFSNSNPSRLGYEMAACGLKVIEYDSEFTKYDLENFVKIKNADEIELAIQKAAPISTDEIKDNKEELKSCLMFFQNLLAPFV